MARDLLDKAGDEVSGSRSSDAGWAGLEIPEATRRCRRLVRETAIVLEELGRAAVREPLTSARRSRSVR